MQINRQSCNTNYGSFDDIKKYDTILISCYTINESEITQC